MMAHKSNGEYVCDMLWMQEELMIGLVFVFYKQGDLKSETIKNLEKYVHRDDRLPILLNR